MKKETHSYRTEIAYNLNTEQGTKVSNYIKNRDCSKYKSIPIYVAAAILNFEETKQFVSLETEIREIKTMLADMQKLLNVVFSKQKQSWVCDIDSVQEKEETTLPEKSQEAVGNEETNEFLKNAMGLLGEWEEKNGAGKRL